MTDGRDEREPAPSPDVLSDASRERRAERRGRDSDGRPLHAEETTPGERGDGQYADSEPRTGGDRPGT